MVEAPPNSPSFVDDLWQRYVADLGNAGPDRGKGAKYVFLPPDFEGDAPDGYFAFRSPTYSNWIVIRALDGLDSPMTTRIYPLALADDPPETGFIDFAKSSFNGIHSNDFSFSKSQHDRPGGTGRRPRSREGRPAGCDRHRAGKPFAPDDHQRRILDQAAKIGAGLARTILFKPRDRAAYYYEDGSWKTAFVGGSHEFIPNGARLLDCRAMMHYVGTGITPAMTHSWVGIGSQYAYTAEDANGDWLDGAKTYTLALPANIPVKTFWAIDIYDTQTRSLLETDNPYPSINNRFADVKTTGDGERSSASARTNREPTSTGCAPSPARAGSRSCASTARSKPGSTNLEARRNRARRACTRRVRDIGHRDHRPWRTPDRAVMTGDCPETA